MDIKNLNIKTQLIIGFTVILFFVIIFGLVSFRLTNKLQEQTEILHSHSLQVGHTMGALKGDILNIRVGIRDLMLAGSNDEIQAAMQQMEIADSDAQKQFDHLYELYLGPEEDIDGAYEEYIVWKTGWEESRQMILNGNIQNVKESIAAEGTVGIFRDQMLASIDKLDNNTKVQSDELFQRSVNVSNTINWQILWLTLIIVLATIIIYTVLLRNIRKPLKALTDFADRFRHGDRSARSNYPYDNEFGILSKAFNDLADEIQRNMTLNEKSSSLADVMLREEDANKFFRMTLNTISTHTGSQIAAIYLLSQDKKTFDHFESIGMDGAPKQSFGADNFEGEFGVALSEAKYQHIKEIPDDTAFMFQTTTGKFIPREILTIPIVSGDEVIAIISLATIKGFSKDTVAFIERSINIMSARIEGILAYRKIKEFSEQLDYQNQELDAQKTELEAQSAELTQQNAELEIQKSQLNEASRLKTNFLANMSHELRTPLNSVIALSGVLSRRLINKIPKEEYSYLEVIERNGKNLLVLINDILDISRIEAGHEEIEITNFDMDDLIDEVVTMIEPQAKEKNIELGYVKDSPKLSITGDKDKCRHILQNLISNGIKFTEKGKVEVSARQIGENLEISVKDTGIGVDAKYLEMIFDEFRQADGSISRKFGGTGLGLAIAKKYANLLGGTVSVKSTVNIGSEFTVSLPLEYDPKNRITEEIILETLPEIKTQTAIGDSNPGGKTILLVEDSEPAVIQIKDLLEESGYHIMVARNAREAFAIIDQVIPDAMILDLMMPGIDGFEALKTLREAETTAHIPVLVLTAKHITKEDLANLKKNNIQQFIQKGDVNRTELENAVKRMLFPTHIQERKPQRSPQSIEDKPVVLVVEDNRDNMITVKALLGDQYTVIEAIDGNEGVEMAKKYIPNLILMDIALPGINGIEAFNAIRKLPLLHHTPIIALTASVMMHDCEKILAHGFDAYITKPVMEKEFTKVIREVLFGK